jgi:hypothetical protein
LSWLGVWVDRGVWFDCFCFGSGWLGFGWSCLAFSVFFSLWFCWFFLHCFVCLIVLAGAAGAVRCVCFFSMFFFKGRFVFVFVFAGLGWVGFGKVFLFFFVL